MQTLLVTGTFNSIQLISLMKIRNVVLHSLSKFADVHCFLSAGAGVKVKESKQNTKTVVLVLRTPPILVLTIYDRQRILILLSLMSSSSPEKMSEAGEKEMTRSIKLPQTIDVALRNIRDAKIFAMDIGGSLTKIAYYSILPLKKIIYDDQETIDEDTAVYEMTEGARLHFIKFETKHIEACLDYIQKRLLGAETDMNMMDVKVQTQCFGHPL